MARLAALLLLVFSLTPAHSLAGDLARAAGGVEIGEAIASPQHEIAPPATPGRLLLGRPIGDSDTASGPEPAVDARRSLCPSIGSLALTAAPPRPAARSCSPHAERLPYHATAPPAVG